VTHHFDPVYVVLVAKPPTLKHDGLAPVAKIEILPDLEVVS
jgi:hypothetical protein